MDNIDIDKEIVVFLQDNHGDKTSKQIADGIGFEATDVSKRLFDMNRRELVFKSKSGKGSKNVYSLVSLDSALAKLLPEKELEKIVPVVVDEPEQSETINDIDIGLKTHDILDKNYKRGVAIDESLINLEIILNAEPMVIDDKELKISVLAKLAELLSDDISEVLDAISIDLSRF